MGIMAVMMFQRKRLLSSFRKNGATSIESAVTMQEIIDKWGIGGIEPVRSHGIEKNIKLLAQRGKIQKTDNEKYYLRGFSK